MAVSTAGNYNVDAIMMECQLIQKHFGKHFAITL